MAKRRFQPVNFDKIGAAALAAAPGILRQWLPSGRRIGSEWISPSPVRADRHAGSFKVNLQSGRWADFATGDRGGDLISLAAFLFSLPQREAALKTAEMLRIDPFEN